MKNEAKELLSVLKKFRCKPEIEQVEAYGAIKHTTCILNKYWEYLGVKPEIGMSRRCLGGSRCNDLLRILGIDEFLCSEAHKKVYKVVNDYKPREIKI